MSFIESNPFRLIGISPSNSEKEIQKQITRIIRYSEVGKEISFDLDLLHLGELERNLESVQEAKRKIEKPENKLLHSLFWFNIENHIDEAGLDSLKNKDDKKALEMWRKVVKDGKVSKKNYSTLSNLKSLLIILGLRKEFNKEYFIEGMNLAGIYFSNSELKGYCKKITGDDTNTSLIELQKKYIDFLYQGLKLSINTKNGITTKDFLSSLSTFSKTVKEEYTDKLSISPINKIENEIKNTSELRDKNPLKSLEYAESLISLVDELKSLEKITDKSDLKYQLISDKFAREILECSICFFNKKINTGIIVKQEAELISEIIHLSEEIACGEQLKTRIKENKEIILDSIESAPDGTKINKVKKEYEFIVDKINKIGKDLGKQEITIAMCRLLIEECTDKIFEIGKNLGKDDELYMSISSRFVTMAMAAQIDYFNRIYTEITWSQLKLFDSLGDFDMDSETRERFVKNKNILKGNYNQNSGGCYIATMVYGDYDHPNVLILRGFRDNYLKNTILGRWFILFYYKYSPKVVELLKNKKSVNLLIKGFLDKLILLLTRA